MLKASLFLLERGMLEILKAVEFRLASPGDEPAIKRLCIECFPVRYPDIWYTELVSSGCYITILACFNRSEFPNRNDCFYSVDNIIGLIVAEYRSLNNCKIHVCLHFVFEIHRNILLIGIFIRIEQLSTLESPQNRWLCTYLA